ncbi:response regulator [Microbacterium sp.]|uniref:response regulator n=1 Tax=Microbacterium sp. TaxID=51671 RepID=UPI003A8A9D62
MTASAATVRVLIVDDHEIVRNGLHMLLDAADGMEVVSHAANGRQAIHEAEMARPDVILMDLRMPEVDGVAATAAITRHHDEIAVLALTTFDDASLVYDALRAGASGYLLKQSAASELIAAIRHVHSGGAWLDPLVAAKVVNVLRGQFTQAGDGVNVITSVLTPREQHVLFLVAQGMSNSEISEALVISEATVKTHVARTLMKTGSRDRAAVVALAWKSGFVHAEQDAPRGDG